MNECLEYYMGLDYTYKLTPETGLGYFIEVVELPGCFGSGKTLDEALADIEVSKRLWFEAALEDGVEIPRPR